MQPSTVNGMDLGAQEWRDAIFLRYGLEPLDLPTYCDGHQATFLISHALDCEKGGLVTARHNELRDRVADLAVKAFNPSHVRDDPLIYPGCAVKRTKATPAGSNGNSGHTAAPEITEQMEELLIRELWQQGTDSVHDMCVVNTDAPTYQKKEPEKCIHKSERGNKNMYLEACLQQRQHFSPFVASVDGLFGVEATGYPFQGSRRLHLQQPVHRGDKG